MKPRPQLATSNLVFMGLAALMLMGFTAIAHGVPAQSTSPLATELRNNLHAPVFAAVSLSLLFVLSRALSIKWAVVLSFMGACVAGISGEGVQYILFGKASLHDLSRDGIGVIAGLVAGLAIRNLWRASGITLRRLVAAFIAVASSLAVSYPAFKTFQSITHQREAFPEILTFERDWERKVFSPVRGAVVLVDTAPVLWSGDSGNAAFVAFGENRFSGLEISPMADWTEYDRLELTASTIDAAGVDVTLRIHDEKHNFHYSDRFSTQLHLTPEKKTYSISIESIVNAPAGRQLDISRIESIIIFQPDSSNGLIAVLDDVRLVRD